MIVLGRGENQCIMVGDNIRIMLVSVNRKNGTARIGIEAPKNVVVDREEIYMLKLTGIRRDGHERTTRPDTDNRRQAVPCGTHLPEKSGSTPLRD